MGHLDMALLRSQEKAYLQHKAAVSGGKGESDDGSQRGCWWNKNQNRKGAGSGTGGASGDLRGTSGGGVGKGKGKGKGKGGKGKRKGRLKLVALGARAVTLSRTALSPMLLLSSPFLSLLSFLFNQ